MGERFVLVTVKIATEGKRCRATCKWLGTYFFVCQLFDKQIALDEAMRPARVGECLALDDRELAPEEAMAHGFGSQP